MSDFDEWRRELLDVAVIAQDDEPEADLDEAERRFNRFIEMLLAVGGDEPGEVFHAVLETLSDQEDYGAYQTVLGVLAKFEPARRGRLTAEGITGVLDRTETMAGDALGQLAFADGEAVRTFNQTAATLPLSDRQRLARFIARQEDGGWLSNEAQRGRLQVPAR